MKHLNIETPTLSPKDLSDAKQKTIDQLLSRLITNSETPSVQYYFFDQETIRYQFCAGYADVAQRKKATINTTYHAFSVTKTFTALAILQLVEKGQIELDRAVSFYLQDFPYSKAMTVRHLLTHTSGLPNPVPLSWVHLTEEHPTFDQNAFFKKVFGKHPKTRSKPGDKFSYSNLGYVVLGQLIEVLSGKTYETYINEHIISALPLDIQDLGFKIPDTSLHAKGYQKRRTVMSLLLGLFMNKAKFMGQPEGQWKPFNYYYINGPAYGGLIGKPIAFVQYLQELLNPESPIISSAYRNLLFRENKTRKGKATGMCLSWFTGKLNRNIYFAHAGGGGGYYCELRIYPDAGLGSVVFFNRTGMKDERILDQLDRILLF